MTDLIKREDATETFAELYDIFDDYPNIVKELHKVYDKILAIPSAENKGEWIPCSERLPDIGDTYLVSGRMKYRSDKEYDYFTDCAVYLPLTCAEYPLGNTGGSDWGTWTDWYEGQDEYEILAWQPLPDPWEGADDE